MPGRKIKQEIIKKTINKEKMENLEDVFEKSNQANDT